jgi:hypothetical protein
MTQQNGSTVAIEIEQKAEELRRLASSEGIEIERLRDETAALQAMLAEAARLQLQERPFNPRGTAVLTPVLLRSRDFSGYCLVSSLSADGMKARIYGNLSREQPVSVHFTSHEQVEGRLVWSASGQVGVQFDARIDTARVLATLGRAAAVGGRARPAPP